MAQTFLDYLAPRTLSVSPASVDRVTLIGGCLFDSWKDVLARSFPAVTLDVISFDHHGAPMPAGSAPSFRIVQIPLRVICSEWLTMPLRLDDAKGHQQVLDFARKTLANIMDNLPRQSCPTFFMNYLVPQKNAFGRFMPRYDLRNPVHLVERINQALSELVVGYQDGHLLDADQMAGVYGRRFVQDDPFWATAHGGLIDDHEAAEDSTRLETSGRLSARYDHDVPGFIEMVWNEATAMFRTLRGVDQVKMVCIDLDDTLWRGVLAEQGGDIQSVEGWPLGFAEALTILAKRGVILAIVSKNDEDVIGALLPKLYDKRLPLDLFAIRKINWRTKVENLQEAIAEANVLPEAVLFIDDNPVERAHALQALPGLRVLGAPHLDWRRILLWSPELDTPAITDESSRRNEMVAAQVARDQLRSQMPRDAFLRDLGVSVTIETMASARHDQFERALELVNKTNQFNTTGRRWTRREADTYFQSGGRWVVATVRDAFAQYGLVAVAVRTHDTLDQFVMSCRVFGLGVEFALLASVFNSTPSLKAVLRETGRNGPCLDFYSKAGWNRDGDGWRPPANMTPPSHVSISEPNAKVRRWGW